MSACTVCVWYSVCAVCMCGVVCVCVVYVRCVYVVCGVVWVSV